MPIKDASQMLIHGVRRHVPQSEHNDAGQLSLTGRDQFTEIEIVHQQNSLFVSGPFQNIGILRLLGPSIHEVYGVVALFS
jgi:hypothetical protein